MDEIAVDLIIFVGSSTPSLSFSDILFLTAEKCQNLHLN